MTIAILLSIVATLALWTGFAVGYKWRDLQDKVAELTYNLSAAAGSKELEPPKATGTVIIDPDDPVQRAKWQREQIMQGLNPDDES